MNNQNIRGLIRERLRTSRHRVIYRVIMQWFMGCYLLNLKKLPFLRGYVYGLFFEMGKGCEVGSYVRLQCRHLTERNRDCDIKIGNNVLLASDVNIDYSGGVELKDNVKISSHALILSHSHPTEHNLYLKKPQLLRFHKVVVEDGAWIGEHAIILPKVTRIGKGAVIGAGSVVGRNIPDYAMVSGNPAKIIGYVPHDEKED